MTNESHGIDLQEKLSRLNRETLKGIEEERTLVTASGTVPPAWTIKILSLDSYNLYDVQLVEIILPGSNPSPIAGNMQAYNIAESFTATGNIGSGTNAVMWRIGKNNVFHVKP